MFAALTNQEKQENDRKRIQAIAFQSASVPPNERNTQDWKNIDAFSKEFPEEIGAEITEFLEWCQYNDIDPKEPIKEFNQKLGG